MDNIKNDEYYLKKMKVCFNRIIEKSKDVSYDEFIKDIDLQEIMMFNLIQISENAKNLSETYRIKNSYIPWVEIFGLRNRIVHDYGNVVMDIIYNTLTKDIPELNSLLFKD